MKPVRVYPKTVFNTIVYIIINDCYMYYVSVICNKGEYSEEKTDHPVDIIARSS